MKVEATILIYCWHNSDVTVGKLKSSNYSRNLKGVFVISQVQHKSLLEIVAMAAVVAALTINNHAVTFSSETEEFNSDSS